MDRVCTTILLGAGASAGAGIPTSRELLSSFIEQASQKELNNFKNAAENSGESFQGILSKGNIETLASVLFNDQNKIWKQLRDFAIKKIRMAEKEMQNVSYLEQIFSKRFDQTLGSIIYRGIKYNASIEGIIRPRVFTLNYDRSVESISPGKWYYLDLFEHGQNCEPGIRFLTERERERNWKNMMRSVHDGFKRMGQIAQDQAFNPGEYDPWKTSGIVKLHGSLNWHWKEIDGERVLAVDENEIGVPEIIFGTPHKLTLKIPYRDLFIMFTRALEESNLLLTIGYSGTDEHINDVIHENVALGMKVIDVRPLQDSNPPEHSFAGKRLLHIDGKAEQVLSQKDVRFGFTGGSWIGKASIDDILYDLTLFNRKDSEEWRFGIFKA